METLPPRRPDQSVPDRRKQRDEYIDRLLGKGPDRFGPLKEQIDELREIILEIAQSIPRDVTITLEGGRKYVITHGDHLILMLGALKATRGEPVDIPLISGDVIEKVRISEFQIIISQVMEGLGAPSEDSSDELSE